MLTDGHPGGVVIGIVANGERTARGYGAVDSSGTTPTEETIFEIGSVTKTFTGLLLADAVERGHVRAEDSLRAFLPDSVALASTAAPITLAHLATHRSGLPRLPSNLTASALANPKDPYANYHTHDLYACLDGYRPPHPPDTAYAYSNLGMGLLDHALARRADTSYAALVRDRIAAPLGLPDTRIRLTPAQQARFAQGHDASGRPTPPWHFPTLAGAGALRSTASDLLTYLSAHLAASDTSSLGRALQRATALHGATDRPRTTLGYGWHRSTRNGQTVVWHNGGTGGFGSFVAFNQATRQGVVILAGAAIAADVTKAGFELMDRLRARTSAQP
mgnify:FL=1